MCLWFQASAAARLWKASESHPTVTYLRKAVVGGPLAKVCVCVGIPPGSIQYQKASVVLKQHLSYKGQDSIQSNIDPSMRRVLEFPQASRTSQNPKPETDDS